LRNEESELGKGLLESKLAMHEAYAYARGGPLGERRLLMMYYYLGE